MHPTISYHLATARAAELRSQAQRGALARAARHARTHQLEHAAPRLAAAGRRLLTSLRPAAPDQPPASCDAASLAADHAEAHLPIRSA
jgi:hypothetical protein